LWEYNDTVLIQKDGLGDVKEEVIDFKRRDKASERKAFTSPKPTIFIY